MPGVNEDNYYTWASLLEQKLGGFVLTTEKINIKRNLDYKRVNI